MDHAPDCSIYSATVLFSCRSDKEMHMWLMLWLTVSMSASLQQPDQVPAAASVSQAASSKIWIGKYSEFEEFIRSAKIERTKTSGRG
jgi:hypothetical protein